MSARRVWRSMGNWLGIQSRIRSMLSVFGISLRRTSRVDSLFAAFFRAFLSRKRRF